MADTTERAPALDLSTLVERPFIRVDGEAFDIYHPDEFSLLDRMLLFSRFDKAMKAARLVSTSDDQDVMRAAAEEATQLLDQAVRSALVDAPDAVHAKLRDPMRVQILKAFTALLAGTAAAAEAEQPAAPSAADDDRSGKSSSPDSSGSTEATRSAG